MKKYRVVSVLLLSLSLLSLSASVAPGELFDEAIQLKEAADAQNRDDLKAAEFFARAADMYEAEAASDWRFWYEAGNARWWAGEADRAILNYRRYLAFDCFRGEVWENLASARISAGTSAPGHEGFLLWPWFLWFASGAAFFTGLGFCSFALFLFFRLRPWRNAAVIIACLALLCGAGSAVSLGARGSLAVVIAETQGRKGDSSVYAPFPSEPWKKGQEVWVGEVRETWTKVLVGDTVSWVPSENLEAIGDK